MKYILILILCIPFLLNAQKLQDRAIGIWDFESSAIADSSGDGNSGTITGTVSIASTSGILGNYAESDGSGGDYITIDPIALGNEWTISFWFKLDAASDEYFIGRYYGQDAIYVDASGIFRYAINNSYYTSGDVVSTGQWYHAVLTYDNSLGSGNINSYLNGTLVGTHNSTSTEARPTSNWQFLANGNNSYSVDGRIDAVAFWSEALDQTTIQDTLYKSGSPVYSSLWTPESGNTRIGKGVFRNGSEVFPFRNGTQAGFSSAIGGDTSPDTGSLIQQINTRLGRGFNAFGVTPMGDNDASNSWTDGEFHNIGTVGGFDNLRLILYSWDGDNSTHLSNISTLIDSCLANDMMAIVDYHQPSWLRDSVLTTYNTNVARWLDDWYKTADYLVNTKGYTNQEIVFELTNEPYNNRTVAGVNYINFDGTTWSNLMQDCVDTIRAAAGNDYAIIVAPYHGTFNYRTNVDATTFPDDTMLIVTTHYYYPNWATHWNLSGTNYGDWEKIQPFFDVIDKDWDHIEALGMPVTVGEWGVYQDTPDSTKAKYLNDMDQYYDDRGYSWSMWDYNWDFGVTTTYGGNTFDATFLNALNNNPTRDYKDYDSTVIEQSDFTSTTDGWTTYTNAGASASLSVESSKLKVTITNTGSASLDLRIISPTIPMYNGHIYRVKYTISWDDTGDNIRNFLAADMDGHWSWYNIYYIDNDPLSEFEMFYQGYATDTGNNFNFYLGGGEIGTFYVHNFTFEEIEIIY